MEARRSHIIKCSRYDALAHSKYKERGGGQPAYTDLALNSHPLGGLTISPDKNDDLISLRFLTLTNLLKSESQSRTC